MQGEGPIGGADGDDGTFGADDEGEPDDAADAVTLGLIGVAGTGVEQDAFGEFLGGDTQVADLAMGFDGLGSFFGGGDVGTLGDGGPDASLILLIGLQGAGSSEVFIGELLELGFTFGGEGGAGLEDLGGHAEDAGMERSVEGLPGLGGEGVGGEDSVAVEGAELEGIVGLGGVEEDGSLEEQGTGGRVRGHEGFAGVGLDGGVGAGLFGGGEPGMFPLFVIGGVGEGLVFAFDGRRDDELNVRGIFGVGLIGDDPQDEIEAFLTDESCLFRVGGDGVPIESQEVAAGLIVVGVGGEALGEQGFGVGVLSDEGGWRDEGQQRQGQEAE